MSEGFSLENAVELGFELTTSYYKALYITMGIESKVTLVYL